MSFSPAKVSRRAFSGSLAAAGTFLITGTKASGNIIGANDRLRIAVVGVNGRGQSHMGGWLGQENVEIAYLVDPDQKVLANALKGLAEKSGGALRRREQPTYARFSRTKISMRFPSPHRTIGTR